MIVIPMAGLSSRFTKAGYSVPKYMLSANNKYLFDYAVESFADYFDSEEFLFICRDLHDTPDFVKARCECMGIKDYEVVVLTHTTDGQAETVALGLEQGGIGDVPITIFNIDTFRPGFKYPSFLEQVDGYLEVFDGVGDNWSYAKPEKPGSLKVVETAEKNPISNLCSTGLYYFNSSKDFLSVFYRVRDEKSNMVNNEYYIAPLYNLLIQSGKTIYYDLISTESIVFCGVPQEYEAFVKLVGAEN